ncbi:MAG: prepilin-type N-terminal cleavage/methylation domain-containing protein [Alphaproteobacteria bacterium]|nr:prepilin-type N-terminal cleavage/methylation domain-containing protein [Alphaproteobacteria bacterium]
MSIRAKSEKGFSLIELLVVVAIIGVLAAVGVVGYQGYIDSTKKSVTDANAKAVHQWLINTKTVRAAGIDTDPVACKAATLTSTTTAAAAVAPSGCFGALALAGNPFESFKNPYSTTRTGADAIRAVADNSTAVTDGTTDCTDLDSSAENGDILIRVSGAGANHIDVYICAKEGDDDGKLTKRDTTITNF